MKQHTLGIRLEDKNKWERRVPVTPDAVAQLVYEHKLKVNIQKSPNRVFDDEQYSAFGANLVDDPFESDVVLAVKEIPEAYFKAGKTYMFFSHTIKGQKKNMPMLKRLMELGCNLLDYEKVTDEHGRRLIFFSWFAGVAGFIDTMYALGKRYELKGIKTPFSQINMTHEYLDLGEARREFSRIGEIIRKDGLPEEICPFVVGIAGYGNVSVGTQSMLKILPVTEITPDELSKIRSMANPPRNTIFKVVFYEKDFVERTDGSAFKLEDYFNKPELFSSTFIKHAPHLNVLINAIYWTQKYPRLLTLNQLKEWYQQGEPLLQVVGDISCDPNGSIESLVKTTNIDNPVFIYNPIDDSVTDGFDGFGLMMMGVDNLPCELPMESSQAFCEALLPFIPALVKADFDQPFASLKLPDPIKKALILHQGVFTPSFEYMRQFVK